VVFGYRMTAKLTLSCLFRRDNDSQKKDASNAMERLGEKHGRAS